MAPIFNVPQAPAFQGLPKAAVTGLFLHRMKQAMAPKPAQNRTAHGHPLVHQPVVIRPKKPVHTSPTHIVNTRASGGIY